jgi:hypothetical protein
MKIINLLVAILLIAGCAPRGESKSLGEVIEAGKARYMAAKGANVSDEIQTKLGVLTTKLDEVLGAAKQGAVNSATLGQIDEMLSELIGHAGVTARAGMNQLSKQYRELSSSSEAASAGAVGLLVGRTYSAIGAELESTKFGL